MCSDKTDDGWRPGGGRRETGGSGAALCYLLYEEAGAPEWMLPNMDIDPSPVISMDGEIMTSPCFRLGWFGSRVWPLIKPIVYRS